MSPPILSTPRSNANSADGALKKPVGKLTRYTIFVCVAAAFGGLTFGYDIGVSGGVTSNRDFLKMVKRKKEVERGIGIGAKVGDEDEEREVGRRTSTKKGVAKLFLVFFSASGGAARKLTTIVIAQLGLWNDWEGNRGALKLFSSS